MIKRICCLMVFFLVVGPAAAQEKDPLWEKRAQAQIEFQRQLADLLLTHAPEYKPLIITSRELQIAMIKARQRRYYFLLANKPDQVIRDQGQSRWVNFEWTEEQEEQLLESDQGYAALRATEDALKERNQDHPHWPPLRAVFTQVVKTEEYQRITKSLTETLEEIDALLQP